MWARMTSELPTSADALLAERARLEEVLQSSEDWCELLRLKSRKDRGEGMSAVNAARLEMVLIDALAEDPNFIRYKAVCVALERLIRGLPPLPAKGEKPPVEKDDLTEIEGITASMQRRLNALDVTTFMQIAEWTLADVKSISADLGIGRQIYEQDWIGQAEELATRFDEPPPPPPAPKYVAPQRSAPPPPPRPVETRQAPVERAPAPPPPPVMREVPRPVEVKPAEVKPAPPPSVVQKFEPAAPPKAELPPVRDKAPADVVQAKPEPKVDAKSDAPQPASVVKTDAPKAEASSGAPAKIASLAELSRLVKTSADDSNSGPVAKDDASARLLPMPPSPLRVQVAPAAPASQQSSDFKPVVPASTPVALRAPPRPFVITRASLPKIEPKAEPKLDAKPEAKTEKPAATPLPTRMPDAAAKPAVAGPMSAAGAPSAPSMSIAEAIAYAAEVARQGPKTQQQPVKPGAPVEPPRNAPPSPANGAALTSPPKAEPPRAAPPPPPPKPVVKAAPAAPAIPPPLPADFVPPPDENADADAAYAQGARAPSSRAADRDDRSDFRAHTEEATVEIVIKSAPEVVATPRAALTKVAAEASANPPRPATPIGRFLKALTGN